MIKKLLFTAAIAALALCSCSNSKKADETSHVTTQEKLNKGEVVTAEAVRELSNDNILRPNATQSSVTFIDFSATWCVPCRKFAPVFDEAASRFADKATFYSVDIDVNPETAQAFGVQAVPTLVILDKEGKEIKRFEGVGDLLPAEKFNTIVESLL